MGPCVWRLRLWETRQTRRRLAACPGLPHPIADFLPSTTAKKNSGRTSQRPPRDMPSGELNIAKGSTPVNPVIADNPSLNPD